MSIKNQPPAKSRQPLRHRHRNFVDTVSRRNKRRTHGTTHTLWPVLYSDILLVAAILAVASFFLIDQPLLLQQRSWDKGFVDIFQIITRAGKSEWYLIVTGVVCLLMVYVDWRGMTRRQQVWLSGLLFDAWFMFTSIAGSGIITIIIKLLVGRARPRHLETLGSAYFDPLRFEASFASFPSGHATTIAALATVLALRFPKLRWLFILLALVVGASRIIVGAHYPSDVIMGFAVGTLFSLFLARMFASRKTGFQFIANGAVEKAIPKRRILRGASPLGPGEIYSLFKRLIGFSG